MRLLVTIFSMFCLALPAWAIDAGGRDNHGEQLSVDLPDEQHVRNTGGSDGAGLCVFCSIDHAARYQDCPALIGFRDFMKRYPGGGWPDKVSQYIPRMAASKGLSAPDYVQHTGGDVEFLRLALKTGRYVCVTYDGRDGVFYKGSISHMVNLVHLSEKWAVIHDNNYPGQYLWMTPDQFLTRWRGGGGGWAIVMLNAPPPPIPTNRSQAQQLATRQEDAMNALLMLTMLTTAHAWDAPACPGGSCAPVRSDSTRHGWYDAGDGQLELFWRGEKIGTLNPLAARWNTAGKSHTVELTKTFGLAPQSKPGCLCTADACACRRCPEDCASVMTAGDDPFPGGVQSDKIRQEPTYELCGRRVSRSAALQAVAAGGLIDDRNKSFLTIVGDESLRSRVVADLNLAPELRGWKDRLHVHAYPPDHWAVRQIGLAPGITFQGPPTEGSNKAPVAWRFRSYQGPLALAEALRKSDPEYRSDTDPDPAKKVEPPTPASEPSKPGESGHGVPVHLLVVVGIGLAAVFGAYRYGRRR